MMNAQYNLASQIFVSEFPYWIDVSSSRVVIERVFSISSGLYCYCERPSIHRVGTLKMVYGPG
jgi:hypothetical protein